MIENSQSWNTSSDRRLEKAKVPKKIHRAKEKCVKGGKVDSCSHLTEYGWFKKKFAMKVKKNAAGNLAHVQQHHGKNFYKKMFFLYCFP